VSIKTIATNKKAYHNYFIGEKMEAGLVLLGSEIKSIRNGRVQLGDAYVKSIGGELWLFNAHIARYDASSYLSHEPTRNRKLLLHSKEVKYLTRQIKEKGLTLIPVRIYIKGNLAKLEVGIAKGKKFYDKREAIAKKDAEREIGRVAKKLRMSGGH